MDKKIRKLMKKAFCGNGVAYRKLGIYFFKGKKCKKDKKLAKLFLERSVELEDEKGYFVYCKLFLKGEKVIDDDSYKAMRKEYESIDDTKRKKQLRKYLKLGTKQQKL